MLVMITTESGSDDRADRITVIADAIRDAYGADAVMVAERQISAAEGASRADWIAVRDHLRKV